MEALGGILEPDMEHILQLQLRDDERSGKVDADATEVRHVILVSQDEHRQGGVHVELDVATVQKAQEAWEDSSAHTLFNKIHLLYTERNSELSMTVDTALSSFNKQS